MRILGITIPDEKRLEMGLITIYGIGRSRAHKILDEAKIEYGKKSKDLNTEEENKIREIVEKFKLEGDLRRLITSNIRRLIDINSFRGRRHLKGLPVRGQRTRTNNRTSRKLVNFLSISKQRKK
jgi:small subunit ribosomal protein S13